MLPWTAPSTLPRSGSHGVLAHQQRGLAGHRGGEGLVQLRSTCLPALSATATWQASRPRAQRRGFCRARPQRGHITHPMIPFPLTECLWSNLGANSLLAVLILRGMSSVASDLFAPRMVLVAKSIFTP